MIRYMTSPRWRADLRALAARWGDVARICTKSYGATQAPVNPADSGRDHGAPPSRTRNDTGRIIPRSSTEGLRTVPSATPGRMASQALNSSSTVRVVPHEAHDLAASAAASEVHAGQRIGTRMEMVTMP